MYSYENLANSAAVPRFGRNRVSRERGEGEREKGGEIIIIGIGPSSSNGEQGKSGGSCNGSTSM